MQAAVEQAPAGPAAMEQTRKRGAAAVEAYTVPAQAGTEDKQPVADRQVEVYGPGEEAAAELAATHTTCWAGGCSSEPEALGPEHLLNRHGCGRHLQADGGSELEVSGRCLPLQSEEWRSSSDGDPAA